MGLTKPVSSKANIKQPTDSDLSAGTDGGDLTWLTITTSQTAVLNHGYFTNSASLITLTLPAVAPAGKRIAIGGQGAGGWTLSRNTGQDISWAGVVNIATLSSVDAHDTVEVICVVANTSWEVRNHEGALTYTLIPPPSTGRGYISGGQYSGFSSIIGRLTYTGETFANISATLSTARDDASGVQSTFKGYTLGGANGSNLSSIEGLTFIGEANATISATLSTTISAAGPNGISSSTKGYDIAYSTSGTATPSTNIDALVFSGETDGTISATLTLAKCESANVTFGNTKGYTMGGQNSGLTQQTEIESLTFSGETTAVLGATLPLAKKTPSSVYSSTKGYCLGGNGSTDIQALTFSGETTALLGAVLNFNVGQQQGSNSSATKGYVYGEFGQTGTEIQALTFSGETIATLSATISAGSDRHAGFQGG